MDPKETARWIMLELGFQRPFETSPISFFYLQDFETGLLSGLVSRICFLKGRKFDQAIRSLKIQFERVVKFMEAIGEREPKALAFRYLDLNSHLSLSSPLEQGVALAALGVFQTDEDIRDWIKLKIMELLQPTSTTLSGIAPRIDQDISLTELAFVILDAHDRKLRAALPNVFRLALEFGEGTLYHHEATSDVDIRVLVLGILNRDARVLPVVSRWFQWYNRRRIRDWNYYEKILKQEFQIPTSSTKSVEELQGIFIYELLRGEINGTKDPRRSFFASNPTVVRHVQRSRPKK